MNFYIYFNLLIILFLIEMCDVIYLSIVLEYKKVISIME